MLTEPPQKPHKITSVLTLVTFPVNVTKIHNQKQLHEGAVHLGFQLESTQFVMAGKSGSRDNAGGLCIRRQEAEQGEC